MKFILISLPRQGTDFISQIIKDTVNSKYKREFLNPKCNKEESLLVKYCGDEINNNNIFRYWEDNEYSIIKNLISRYTFQWSKENYVFLNIPHLQHDYDLFCLYRARQYTFPSSRPEYYLAMFHSFINNTYFHVPILGHNLEKIKNWCSSTKNPIQKQCFIHIISWYIIEKYCLHFEIPILDFHQLMNLQKNDLEEYLKKINIFRDYCVQLTDNIISNRKKYLHKVREFEYCALCVEPMCQELITFIKTIDDAPLCLLE